MGLVDRQQERDRKAKIKELARANEAIPSDLLVPIVDREKIWNAEQAEIKRQEELRMELAKDQVEDDEEEVQFFFDTVGDRNVQQELQRERERELEEEKDGFIPLVPKGPLIPNWYRAVSSSSEEEESSECDSDEQLAVPSLRRFR
jgi:hypothetical protein